MAGAPEYAFFTRWRLKATAEEVFDVLADPLGLKRWCPTFSRRQASDRRKVCSGKMNFAYSETARTIRGVLGSVLRGRREAAGRTLTEIAAEAGLSPAHLSEVERGRKEVSIERLIAVAHALGVRPADVYAELARQLGAEPDQRSWPDDPPVKLRLATASLPLEALRSVADFSAYLAMANPPPKPKDRIGFLPTRR